MKRCEALQKMHNIFGYYSSLVATHERSSRPSDPQRDKADWTGSSVIVVSIGRSVAPHDPALSKKSSAGGMQHRHLNSQVELGKYYGK